MKHLLTLFSIGLLSLTLSSCKKEKPKPPPPVIVEAPDYTPISEGWKVQSYALIGIAVIVAVVVMGKGKDD